MQLIGTLLFNISTFAALNTNLTTRQANARVWAPDTFGSIAFLVASELAFAEVCHRWISFRNRTLSWKIVALNLLGSIAFGASAVASLIEPSSGEAVSARIANAGTSFGGLCFLIGALLLMPEAAAEERAAAAGAQPGARGPAEPAAPTPRRTLRAGRREEEPLASARCAHLTGCLELTACQFSGSTRFRWASEASTTSIT